MAPTTRGSFPPSTKSYLPSPLKSRFSFFWRWSCLGIILCYTKWSHGRRLRVYSSRTFGSCQLTAYMTAATPTVFPQLYTTSIRIRFPSMARPLGGLCSSLSAPFSQKHTSHYRSFSTRIGGSTALSLGSQHNTISYVTRVWRGLGLLGLGWGPFCNLGEH
jgi:hypothetical protein